MGYNAHIHTQHLEAAREYRCPGTIAQRTSKEQEKAERSSEIPAHHRIIARLRPPSTPEPRREERRQATFEPRATEAQSPSSGFESRKSCSPRGTNPRTTLSHIGRAHRPCPEARRSSTPDRRRRRREPAPANNCSNITVEQ